MEPNFVTRLAFTLVGMMMRVKPQGKVPGQLWDEFGPRMGEIQHTAAPDVAYGVSDNMDMATGEFDYYAGLEASSSVDIPAGMVSLDVPAQTYAVFPCTLPTIRETYQDIYGIWLPMSGYVRAPGPELEVYGETLARLLAETQDRSGIQEIAENLSNKNSDIQSNCLKVLYETGYLAPELIAPYAADFLKLLHSRQNRMVWGAMIGLSTISLSHHLTTALPHYRTISPSHYHEQNRQT